MASPLVLRTAIGKYPYVQALKDGSVHSDRVRLEYVEVEPLNQAFRRLLRDGEFDVCEMALTTHALAHAFGKPYTAIPIILHRNFHHGAIACAKNAPLRGPSDLSGRRVGVRAYSQTTGVWVRGILQHEYGVDVGSITWVTTEDAHVAEYRDPPNVERAAEGKGLRTMLLAGEIDAAIGLRQEDPNEVRKVIPDTDAAAASWYRKTGIYPANHAVVIKNDLLAKHPWLGTELMTMFAESKRQAQKTPVSAAEARLKALVGDDPHPYGLAANRKPIEMVLAFSTEQKLTPRAYKIEELFDAKSLAWA
ncbi:MAG: hypothetical protein HY246_17825 [Proteobacteria bacterium]|nr:hypothetical protein [Pseudomonadota bacterium]